jgi:hypothetical protein
MWLATCGLSPALFSVRLSVGQPEPVFGSDRAVFKSCLPRLAVTLLLMWAPLAQPQEEPRSVPSVPRSTVIVNAQLADGTGGPLRRGLIRVALGLFRGCSASCCGRNIG